MNILNNLKQHFEHNMLDGDDLKDCGGAMLNAEFVFEYMQETLQDALKEFAEEIRLERELAIPKEDFERGLASGWNHAVEEQPQLITNALNKGKE